MSHPRSDRDSAPLATARQRTLAYLLDLCLVGGPLLAAVHDRDRSIACEVVSFLALSTLAGTLYHVILEGTCGRTVGKALVGIEVIRTDGSPCTLRAATIRTAARVVDALPIGYALGLGSIVASHRRQRIGDRLADTIIVRCSPPTELRESGRADRAPEVDAGGSGPVAESS